jgi:proline iminopeptidase
MDADPEVHMSMARALMRYQLLNTNNSPSLEVVKQVLEDDRRVLSLVRNFVHYNFHQCFLQPNQVLANLSKITHRPCMIIHGSLDDVCPLELASLVHENWQNSELLMSF